jgi:site-specific recombinase XerD
MHPHPNATPSTSLRRDRDEPDMNTVGTARPTTPPSNTRVSLETAGRQYIAQRRALGRKKSTLEDYESTLRVHLVPFFGTSTLDEIDVPLVEAFIYTKLDEGKAPKSIRNYVGLLHSILDHGLKRGWCQGNPVASVEGPRADRNPDIRFHSLGELEAILAATPATPLG